MSLIPYGEVQAIDIFLQIGPLSRTRQVISCATHVFDSLNLPFSLYTVTRHSGPRPDEVDYTLPIPSQLRREPYLYKVQEQE